MIINLSFRVLYATQGAVGARADLSPLSVHNSARFMAVGASVLAVLVSAVKTVQCSKWPRCYT